MEERAVWNEVSTDFDPDEETANFGTRHALESGDNLYEVIISDLGPHFYFLSLIKI